MRYIRYALIMIVFAVTNIDVSQGQGTSTKNYTLVKTYVTPNSSVSDIIYTDGFGRKLQEIAINATPSGSGDIITPFVYGTMGRVEKQYLPYTRNGNNGYYYSNSTTSSNWNNNYGSTDAPNAYTLTAYDNSPLNRVVKQTGPGQAWHSAGKGVTTIYSTNTGNEVRLYRVDVSGALIYSGYYTAGRLQKMTTTDEDGNSMDVFTDNQDRVLLSVSKDGTTPMETYNVYDDRDLLRYVLSPEASFQLGTAISETVLQSLAYRYDYDLRGHLVSKRLPGCDPVYMVYDNKDRMVMSQDGKQRQENANKWNYSIYDSKSRVIETGEILVSGTTGHASLQNAALASDNYIPTGTRSALQYTLYDTYTPTANVPVLAFVAVSGYSSGYNTLTAGMVTSIKTKVLDMPSDTWLSTTTYYDDLGRLIQTVSDNIQGGKSQVDMKYDFTDHLIGQRESHNNANIVEKTHTYDNRGRLLSSSTRLNNGSPATVTYTYDDLGRLTSKTMGSTTESIVYNVRGWLTSKQSTPFKMNLRYHNPEGGAAARWNGNISEWDWQHDTNTALMYGFSYDGVNRLTATAEKQKSGASWVALTASYLENSITYDRNSNIKTLQRTAAGNLIDNLTYTNTGNQLTYLFESVRTSPTNDIYLAGSNASDSYSYDKNGNMIADSRKGLNFSYNSLNLLSDVKFGSIVRAKYCYLADGSKLRVRDAGSNGFDYLGSLTYTSNSLGLQLESAAFGDGVIRVTGTSQEINYFLTDHLGSVRVIVDKNGAVKERNDYYAFGAKHIRGDYPQSDNRYDYNGKEEQTTGDLKFLDYGARMYDGALGRWFNVDPLAEKQQRLTPYHFCSNNPINRIDLDGKWDVTIHLYNDRKKYGYGIAIVTDRKGNEVYRFDVRAEGVGGRNRMKSNSDTPLGTYDIPEYIWITGGDRNAYGPNARLAMDSESGEIETSGRSLIRIHGGRQEDEYGNPLENPTLKKTHGCLRAYDTDMLGFKNIIDELMVNDTDEYGGTVYILDNLMQKKTWKGIPYKADMTITTYHAPGANASQNENDNWTNMLIGLFTGKLWQNW